MGKEALKVTQDSSPPCLSLPGTWWPTKLQGAKNSGRPPLWRQLGFLGGARGVQRLGFEVGTEGLVGRRERPDWPPMR